MRAWRRMTTSKSDWKLAPKRYSCARQCKNDDLQVHVRPLENACVLMLASKAWSWMMMWSFSHTHTHTLEHTCVLMTKSITRKYTPESLNSGMSNRRISALQPVNKISGLAREKQLWVDMTREDKDQRYEGTRRMFRRGWMLPRKCEEMAWGDAKNTPWEMQRRWFENGKRYAWGSAKVWYCRIMLWFLV